MTPNFQACGTVCVNKQWLNMCSRAGIKDGHVFRIVYGIWSTGLGLDADLALALLTSLAVNSLMDTIIELELEYKYHMQDKNE